MELNCLEVYDEQFLDKDCLTALVQVHLDAVSIQEEMYQLTGRKVSLNCDRIKENATVMMKERIKQTQNTKAKIDKAFEQTNRLKLQTQLELQTFQDKQITLSQQIFASKGLQKILERLSTSPFHSESELLTIYDLIETDYTALFHEEFKQKTVQLEKHLHELRMLDLLEIRTQKYPNKATMFNLALVFTLLNPQRYRYFKKELANLCQRQDDNAFWMKQIMVEFAQPSQFMERLKTLISDQISNDRIRDIAISKDIWMLQFQYSEQWLTNSQLIPKSKSRVSEFSQSLVKLVIELMDHQYILTQLSMIGEYLQSTKSSFTNALETLQQIEISLKQRLDQHNKSFDIDSNKASQFKINQLLENLKADCELMSTSTKIKVLSLQFTALIIYGSQMTKQYRLLFHKRVQEIRLSIFGEEGKPVDPQELFPVTFHRMLFLSQSGSMPLFAIDPCGLVKTKYIEAYKRLSNRKIITVLQADPLIGERLSLIKDTKIDLLVIDRCKPNMDLSIIEKVDQFRKQGVRVLFLSNHSQQCIFPQEMLESFMFINLSDSIVSKLRDEDIIVDDSHLFCPKQMLSMSSELNL
ncbi:hypothetical protein FGO68_gene475 [Halteria grandinella]|uniref:Uncharacterized protein n=1 Tax=Halteria grandinella TaxID=5974 RepID=A0A8J8NTN6_HALGN|nr:hypothetical protein FGO68_gene475 [Halteria grandinella]